MKANKKKQNQQSKMQTNAEVENKIKNSVVRIQKHQNNVRSSSSESISSYQSSQSQKSSSKRDNNKREASNKINTQQFTKKIKKQHTLQNQIDQSEESESNLSSITMTQKQYDQLDQVNNMKTQEESKYKKKKKEVKEINNKIQVDKHFKLGEEYSVFQDKGIIYSTTLNQARIFTNKNKFIVLQILYNKDKKSFLFCTRQGSYRKIKSNKTGVVLKNVCNTKQMAFRLYQETIKLKSVKGQYKFISHHQGTYDSQQQQQIIKKKQKKFKKRNNIFIQDVHVTKWKQQDLDKSTLRQQIKQLMIILFDTKMMDNHMKSLGYHLNKIPLGKLNQITITKAYKVLKLLLDQVKKQDPNLDQIQQLNHDFYSYIPHDFGFSKMLHHILRTQIKIKQKLQMLDSLSHIIVGRNIINQNIQNVNIIDQNYSKLNRDIVVLPTSSQEYKTIKKYVELTHSLQRSSYTFDIKNIFKISNQGQKEKFTEQIGNKKMLWYGSRLTNYVSILSQGLKIPHEQAPETGFLLGKGIYFSDIVTKAGNLCFANPKNNSGLLLLCQVALGQFVEKAKIDHKAHNLPVGKNSTKGKGKFSLNPQLSFDLDGLKFEFEFNQQVEKNQTPFLYNQYVVYKPEQVRMKYLVQVQFKFP